MSPSLVRFQPHEFILHPKHRWRCARLVIEIGPFKPVRVLRVQSIKVMHVAFNHRKKDRSLLDPFGSCRLRWLGHWVFSPGDGDRHPAGAYSGVGVAGNTSDFQSEVSGSYPLRRMCIFLLFLHFFYFFLIML